MSLDTVTFEVIRNRLWTINIAHGEALTRISGPSTSDSDWVSMFSAALLAA